jgi:hypothetical protein
VHIVDATIGYVQTENLIYRAIGLSFVGFDVLRIRPRQPFCILLSSICKYSLLVAIIELAFLLTL